MHVCKNAVFERHRYLFHYVWLHRLLTVTVPDTILILQIIDSIRHGMRLVQDCDFTEYSSDILND